MTKSESEEVTKLSQNIIVDTIISIIDITKLIEIYERFPKSHNQERRLILNQLAMQMFKEKIQLLNKCQDLKLKKPWLVKILKDAAAGTLAEKKKSS